MEGILLFQIQDHKPLNSCTSDSNEKLASLMELL